MKNYFLFFNGRSCEAYVLQQNHSRSYFFLLTKGSKNKTTNSTVYHSFVCDFICMLFFKVSFSSNKTLSIRTLFCFYRVEVILQNELIDVFQQRILWYISCYLHYFVKFSQLFSSVKSSLLYCH